MIKLAFVIIISLPGHHFETVAARGLTEAQCLPMQQAVWDSDNAVAYYDDQGAVPVLDAACVPETQLTGREN